MKKRYIIIGCLLFGMMCFNSTTIQAQENRIYTEHGTYIENGKEYTLEGAFLKDVDGSLIENEDVLNPDTEDTEPNNEQETLPEIPVEPDETVPEEPETEIPEELEPPVEEEKPVDPESPEIEVPEVPVEKPIEPTPSPIEPSEPSEPQTPVFNQPQQTVVTSIPKVELPTINSYENPYPSKGIIGSLTKALLFDDFLFKDFTRFSILGNPFMIGQCTWFAWARFYQVYGFDSMARGNGKTNAYEIVQNHPDKFELSSTPSAGSVFSMERNTMKPQYGHVGFVEAFDGEYIWISEGNVLFGGTEGNIWIHKVRFEDFKAQYPDVVFAIPKKVEKKVEKKEIEPIHSKKMNLVIPKRCRGHFILMKM